jgi:hypothetical protein
VQRKSCAPNEKEELQRDGYLKGLAIDRNRSVEGSVRLCIDQVIKHSGFLLFIIGGRTNGVTVTMNFFTWVFKGKGGTGDIARGIQNTEHVGTKEDQDTLVRPGTITRV